MNDKTCKPELSLRGNETVTRSDPIDLTAPYSLWLISAEADRRIIIKSLSISTEVMSDFRLIAVGDGHNPNSGELPFYILFGEEERRIPELISSANEMFIFISLSDSFQNGPSPTASVTVSTVPSSCKYMVDGSHMTEQD